MQIEITNPFVLIYLSGSVLYLIAAAVLERINYSFRQKHGCEVPPVLEGIVEESALEKAVHYKNARDKIWLPRALVVFALDLYLVFSCYFPAVFEKADLSFGGVFLTGYQFFILAMIPEFIVSIPFELYSEFGIEKQFGFSRMTFGFWIGDKIKSIFLTLLISAPLIFIAGLLFKFCSNIWWLLLGIFYLAFSLGVSVIYPVFIAPLFNKFTPLEDGELKDRLENLLKKCNFKSSGLFVMDASKRSNHSNAYFTGFGKSKRVVLYDTLLKQLAPEEIEAVLGHELGHFKKHHILKKMLVMIPLTFIVLFAISIFTAMPFFYESFGFNPGEKVPPAMMFAGFLLVQITFSNWTSFLSPIANYFSRKDEFEADKFSKELCGAGEYLASALVKLNKENLSDLQVPKIYSTVNYDHPPLLERLNALLG